MNETRTGGIAAMFMELNSPTWFIIGFALLIIELVTGTTYILWPAAAALLMGVILFAVPMGWQAQLLLFAVLSVVFLFLGDRFIRPKMNKPTDAPDLNKRSAQLIGERVKAIRTFDSGRGRVKLGDTEWSARTESANPQGGDELKVVRVDGTTLVVEPL